MKKFISILICTLYLVSTQTCFAISNLYFVKNTQKATLQNIVQQGIAKDKKYTLRKINPFLALTNDGKDYALIILQTSSNNVFYYYQASNSQKIDKAIKKLMTKQNIEFEQSQNPMYISTFEKQAQKVLTNTTSNYDFSETKTQQNNVAPYKRKTDNTVLKGYVGEVAKGSTFNAYLQTPINTSNAKVGDVITAVLTQNWVYNGNIIASQGSVLSGTLSKAQSATYGLRNGQVAIDFNNLTTPDGKIYNLSTEKIDFTVTNDGVLKKIAVDATKRAVIGAISGLIIALCCSSSSKASSSLIGAGIGASTAVVSSAFDKGIDAEIPTYTELEITLTKPLNVIFHY